MVRKLAVVAVLVGLVLSSGCSGSGSSGGGSSYLGTQSPGDVWTWEIGATTFSATNLTNSYTYSGTRETLESGFLKLTVTTTTDPGVTPPATAYAMEFPGTALMVKPAGVDTNVIVCVGQGACPTTGATYNWVMIPFNGWNATTDEAYGTVTSTVSGNTFSFNISPRLLDGTSLSSSTENDWMCNGGRFSKTGESMTFGVLPSGGFVSDNGPGMGGFVGMSVPSLNADLAAAASKSYRGFLFRNNAVAEEDTQLIGANPGTGINAGKLVGFGYTNVETNTSAGDSVVVEFTTQISPGLISGTITDDGGPHSTIFMVNEVDGRWVVFGISTDSSSTEPYNFLVIEQ